MQNYVGEYLTVDRFISYFHQIDIMRKLNISSVLEVGVGDKTVSRYVYHNTGISIHTMDVDKYLNPMIVSDIRKFTTKYKYDLISVCEVLEHIPFDDFDVALKRLSKATNKYVLISLPYASYVFEFNLIFPGIKKLFKRDSLTLRLRIPKFFKRFNPKKGYDDHHWEIGGNLTPKGLVTDEIRMYFKILKQGSFAYDPYRYYYLLEKK